MLWVYWVPSQKPFATLERLNSRSSDPRFSRGSGNVRIGGSGGEPEYAARSPLSTHTKGGFPTRTFRFGQRWRWERKKRPALDLISGSMTAAVFSLAIVSLRTVACDDWGREGQIWSRRGNRAASRSLRAKTTTHSIFRNRTPIARLSLGPKFMSSTRAIASICSG